MSDSVQFCWDKGGYLAEVTSAEEQLALDSFLLNGADFWLGLSDIEQEGWIILTITDWCRHLSLLQGCTSGRRAGRRRTTPTGTPTSPTARPRRTVSSSSPGLTRQTSGTTSRAPLWGKGKPSSTLSVRAKCRRKTFSKSKTFIVFLCQIFSYKI